MESFNGKFREECLSEHWFRDIAHARRIIETWRRDYNEVRPHSALGYRPPAPETIWHHRPVPAFASEGLRPKRASEQTANKLTFNVV